MTASQKKTVLVVGGGMGGLSAIVGLKNKLKKQEHCGLRIVLVEPKDYCETVWATFRSPWDPKVARAAMHNLEPFCLKNKVEHLRTTVTKLTPTEATLANGDMLSFDVCVVAVGAAGRWPLLGRGKPSDHNSPDGAKETRLATLAKEGPAILKSKSVLIIGGGLVGTEVAGDVKVIAAEQGNTEMEVTLVHSGDQLCPEMSASAAKLVLRKLTKLGVRVVLGDCAIAVEGQDKYQLKSTGEEIIAEHVIPTVGWYPITSFVDWNAHNEQGYLETDDYLLVKGGNGRIFAVGDCGTTLPNSGNQILHNMDTLGHNLAAVIQNKVKEAEIQTSLKKVTPNVGAYMATIGPHDGVLSTPMFTTTWFIPRLKNRTMLFFAVKQKLGVEIDE